ncbi:unnamed protein product [Schistocephalus solidus]|uniref:LYZ2 domain-containing protein n=1 Tax=Schistocephalus solidus TaxID=70667 RepID=A0A183SWQ7_SCHSO|nr:unnamed protein product [Schistocephalus solidus]
MSLSTLRLPVPLFRRRFPLCHRRGGGTVGHGGRYLNSSGCTLSGQMGASRGWNPAEAILRSQTVLETGWGSEGAKV